MRRILYIFAKLEDEDVEWLADEGRALSLKPGTTLVREGQPLDAIYILIDGHLAVSVASHEIARLSCGEVVGELSFFDERPPSATVSSVGDAVVLAVRRAALRVKLGEDPAFAARFYHALGVFLAIRLRTAIGKLGFGSAGRPDEDGEIQDDELGAGLLDEVSVAGARFDWLLRRVRGRHA